ncbi:hypothetical protein GWI33_017868 [Rhynchophorus ferrugineus]|uniref:Uncharacterized protein n=1 Tax=Rhynchophorus ferrugineus TaxID=354439 RepID=A0A834HXG1_RHYFE|nr:hypothetical protein GWI33_017868 [Rhynchophorus ferrugineus]
MWNTYEPKCLKECLFNPVLLYMTNLLIYNINKVEEIDWRNCSCMEIMKQRSKHELTKSEHYNSNPDLIAYILTRF